MNELIRTSQNQFKVNTNRFNNNTSTAIIKDDVLICSEVDMNSINIDQSFGYVIENTQNEVLILSRSKRFKNIDTDIKHTEIIKAYQIEELKRGMRINDNI